MRQRMQSCKYFCQLHHHRLRLRNQRPAGLLLRKQALAGIKMDSTDNGLNTTVRICQTVTGMSPSRVQSLPKTVLSLNSMASAEIA
eukprot:m.692039 g.692039  ORF g.692039 m.692039 type:complete len:86 (+) comp22859_c0_seq2:2660-2917(+)